MLEEIARGGMGVVYRARHRILNRIVALKMILAGQFASKQIIQRFRGEVTAAALLQHPNIVAIHDVGIHEDQHYFAMDYVDGRDLSQLVGTRPLLPAKAARYMKLAAEAIHYAHDQGILHRDLKPSNVLIDSTTDQPRITDFGLAKRLDGESSLTLTGQVLGSPNFMPPEQAGSGHGKVGRQSDVYGLGAILYYLLVARPPFQADSLPGIVTLVLESDPIAPRSLNSSVPRDLETICLKCLSKESNKRYSTASDLAEDLCRFLRDEPIRARPVSRAERTWRWCRRNPMITSLGVALILAIIIGFGGIAWQLRGISREEATTRRNLYTANMNLAHQAWNEGSLQVAQKLLRAHLPQPGKEDLRGFEWRYLSKLCEDESLFTFANVYSVGERHRLALASDGQTVIIGSGDTLKWLDWRKQREVRVMAVGPKAITGLTLAKGQPGLIAYRTDKIEVLSSRDESLLHTRLPAGLGTGIDPAWRDQFALSWDGALLAAPGTNSTISVFEVATGRPLSPEFYLGKNEDVLCLAFSPNGNYLACGTYGTKIHILEVPGLKRVHLLTNHTAFVTCLSFDRSGKTLASGCNDSHIRLWRFPDCAPLADLTGHHGSIGDLAFSPNGLHLASGGSDHTVRLWNIAAAGAHSILHGHSDTVQSLVFSSDGNQLFTGSDDGSVKVWGISSAQSTNMLRHSGYAADVAFSPDGTLVAVADYSALTAVLWKLPDQIQLGTVGDHVGKCTGVEFSPDNKLLATVGGDEIVQIWEISPIKKRFNLIQNEDTRGLLNGGSLAFHPQQPILAVGCINLRLWNLQNGALLNPLAGAPTGRVGSVAFSRDGKSIALGMLDGQVSILDYASGNLLHSFNVHSTKVASLCFSHNGNFLVSGGNDHQVFFHDLRHRVTVPLEGHKEEVWSLAFAPDDKTLASACQDGFLRLWSVANRQVALKLSHDGGPVTSVAFSRNGNLMATSGSDGVVRLWPAAEIR